MLVSRFTNIVYIYICMEMLLNIKTNDTKEVTGFETQWDVNHTNITTRCRSSTKKIIKKNQ
jgi:hypothetical protein